MLSPTVGDHLDVLLTRTYRRFGRNYRRLFVAVACVNGSFAGTVLAVTSMPLLGATRRELIEIAVVGAGLSTVCVIATYARFRRVLTPVWDWLQGDGAADTAAKTWEVAVRESERLIVAGIGVFSVGFLWLPLFLWSRLDLPDYMIPLIAVVVEVAILFAAALDYFSLARLLRPVLRDISRQLPDDFEPEHRTVPLAARMILVSTVVVVFASYVTASLAGSFSPTGRLVAGFLVGVGAMLLLGLPPGFLLADSLSIPINELVAATRRVEQGDYGTAVPVLAADEVGVLARSFNRMQRGLRERETLRAAMGSYVDPDVASRILDEGELLSGVELEVTVMFVDLRGYTGAAEHRTPQQTVAMLNQFFELVVPLIASGGGVVNKFLGDGLLAVFGAPTPVPDHADRAVRTAATLVAEVQEAFDGTLAVGVGLNSGPVVVGSIGGGGRLEFALIGDVVNVASRVEQLTKELSTPILATDATVRGLTTPAGGVVARGPLTVRGRDQPVDVFAVPVTTASAAPPA